MPPGVLANKLPQLYVVLQFSSRYLLRKNEVRALQFFRDASNSANAFNHGGEIVTAEIGPFLEIVEIDPRWVPRIARLPRDGSTPAGGMRFQQRDGETALSV